MVSDAVVRMCVKVESTFYAHTSVADLFKKITSVVEPSCINEVLKYLIPIFGHYALLLMTALLLKPTI